VLRPVGFGADEGMLPFSGRSFVAYRLLQEYFTFPEKFLFFDLSGFQQVRAAGFGAAIEVILLISPFERTERRPMLEAGVSPRTFRLGCTPVVNLFKQTSEPILLTQRRSEYVIVPDARRRLTTEVFTVDEVVGITPGSPDPVRFEPFHVHGRTDERRAGGGRYWYASRRFSGWRTDSGTDVFLSLVDRSGRTIDPELDVATARLTCFNGDLPSRLPFGEESGDFELEGGGPVKRIVALVKPTAVVQPPLGQPLLWRLVSQLALNYMSLVDSGPETLQEILRLHNVAGSPASELQIRGIRAIRSGPTFARVASENGLAFARGRRVEIDFDEEDFAGGGVYLFASVIEHFLAMNASLNSFSALTARTRQRKQPLRQWAPRSGWKTLL
jgi:type VI secretion system protein ImpG